MRPVLRILAITLAVLTAGCLLALLIPRLGANLEDGWHLEFRGFNSSLRFWIVFLSCGVAVAATVLLFQYEQRLISRRLGTTLLSLRLLLILMLFLMLLEPLWTWNFSERLSGRVLLAVDVSESMDTHDVQGTRAEKLHWALALGMITNPEMRARAESWLAAARGGNEPEWVTPEEEPDAARREQLAVARQQAFDSLLKELDQFSRLELVRRALNSQPTSPLEQLRPLVDLQVAVVADGWKQLAPDQVDRLAQPNALNMNRGRSNLGQTADAARGTEEGPPLAGVVLLSDGHDTNTHEANRIVDRLKGIEVPVHTVLVGSAHRPRDLSVLHIDHPESVFKEDQPLVKGILQTSGYENQPVTVSLTALGEPDAQPLRQVVTPSGPSTEVSFTLPPLETGRHRYQLSVDPLPGEMREDNNAREFAFNVIDDRARVLLVDGLARWEFRYLSAALSRDDRIQLDQVVFEQPWMGVLPQPFFPTRLPVSQNPDSSPFAAYDIVLLGDVSPEQMPESQWQSLERYVRDEGGTLVLTAGHRFFPRSFAGTSVDALLPVEGVQAFVPRDAAQTGPPPVRGFRLGITPDGQQQPMFQLGGTLAESLAIWGRLPGHPWGLVGRAKGGATVWATLAGGGVRSLREEREQALIVQQHLGSGQVVWIGIDSTWRWRYLVGDLYHHRFWGQLVRWAVSFKSNAGNENVKLALKGSIINAGESATVQARWNQRFLDQHPGMQAEILVERTSPAEQFTRSVPLAARPGNRLLEEALTGALPEGEYKIQLVVKGADLGQPLSDLLLVVNPRLSAEMRDVSANQPLLERISRETGGRFLYLNQLNQLPELFADVTQETFQVEERPLWNHWLMLLLFCSLATGEWVLRKLNGLP